MIYDRFDTCDWNPKDGRVRNDQRHIGDYAYCQLRTNDICNEYLQRMV